ncbi:hypothetical protein Dvina_29915 [Dactylosporangium vinaceum]|uniref:DUF5666 domain-containing protein n=1 Tax=Dactylosporangium vinaceum TaxID=53362 RepID=A0ABV5LZ84_9ACTN|nr:hypothetical protein [Dactylosporangium vinaceum]UAB92555.1 hypothetical protein Dvina_29915 [Dactylosporangium vinaceum]
MGAFKLTQPRIAILVLALIAVLYVLSAVNHTGGDSTALRKPGGFVGWLGHRFGGTPDAARADLSAPCLLEEKLTVKNGTCTLTVAKSTVDQRRVRLRSESDVAVQAPAPGRDTLVRSDVEAGSTVSVAVGKGGAQIDVICAGERTCVLTLMTGE